MRGYNDPTPDVSGINAPVCTSHGMIGSVPGMKYSLTTTDGGQYGVASMFVLTSTCRWTMSAGIGQSRGAGRRR